MYAQLYFEANHCVPLVKSETGCTVRKTGDDQDPPVTMHKIYAKHIPVSVEKTSVKESSSGAAAKKGKSDIEKECQIQNTQVRSSARTNSRIVL